MNITVYGDSIFEGVRMENGSYHRDRSWEQNLAKDLGCVIRNHSRFGCTLPKALPALRKEMEKPGEPGDLVLLELGGNDCDYDWAAIAEDPAGRYLCKTPAEQFVADYRQAIRLIRDSGRTPVAVNLPPIHAERYLSFVCRDGLNRENIFTWLRDVEAISRWQKLYSDLVVQLAREEHTELIDLRSAIPGGDASLEDCLCLDGIHPSRLGQERICQTLLASAAKRNYQNQKEVQ